LSCKRLVLLDGALLGLAVLASRAALLLHEAVGHGAIALALGANGFTLRLSLFGGGAAHVSGLRTTDAGYALFSLGGIGLNLLTGAAAWFAARRLRRRGLLYAFLLMFGAGSMGQALFYLANGFYYGEGDPQGFVGRGGDLSRLQWMWVLWVVPFAALAWLAARGWLDFLAGHAALDTLRRRLWSAFATVGIVTAAYFGLWGLTWDSRVDVTMRQQRVRTEIAREMQRRPPPPPPPPATPTPTPAPVPAPTPPPVTEADVAPKIPPPVATITMFVAGLLGAAVALWRSRPQPAEPATLTPIAAAIPMALAAAVIGGIAMLGR
jgi:hypothetical protein